MTKRIVVIGGDATGMSAASTALRHAEEGALEVVVLERGHYTSYSACGIPYWIAGDVGSRDELDRPHARAAPRGRDRPADAHGGDGDRPRRSGR